MDESESVAQPTPGTSSGTDSATIPPVLTEQDITGAALNEPLDLSPEFWSGKFWSGGPKFSVENWSGRTDFFGKNGPPLENWSE